MAGVDASIPLGIKVPDGMATLGNLMGAAKNATQLQLGNVELQKNEIALQERKGIQDLFSRAESFKNPDGQFDYNRLIEEGMKVAPTTFPAMVPQIIQARKLGTEAEQAFSNLNESTRAAAGQWFMGQRGKPLEQVTSEAAEIKKLNPALSPAIDSSLKVLQMAKGGGQPALDAAYLRLGQHAMPPATQADVMTPGGPAFNTGQVSGQINTKPLAGPPGPIPGTMTQNVVPPTQAEDIVQDAQGNRYRAIKSPQGVITIEPIQQGGGAAPTAAPGPRPAAAPPMMALPPGESAQSAAALAQERQAAQQTLAGAPVMHHTNRGIMEEIDKVAATGAAGPRLQTILSTLGSKFDTPEEKASAYDLLGKYLERNAIVAAQSMGPHTNAGLESQIKAQGSVAYNPTAIKKLTQLNDALVTGTEQYQPGLEKAITSSPDQIFAKRAYDQQWAQNFDPRIMMLYNAKSAGNQREVDEIVKSWGGADSATTKDMLRRAKNLSTLSAQGRL